MAITEEVIAGGQQRRGCKWKLKQNIFIHCVLDLHSWRKDLRENGGSNSLRGIEEEKEESSFPLSLFFSFPGFFLTHYTIHTYKENYVFCPYFLDRLQ